MFKKIIKPKRLEKGNTIGIISPSGSASYDKKSFKKGLDIIKNLGFHIKLGKNVYAELDEHKYNYSAGTIEQRIEDLHWAFEDNEVDGIICSTGGDTAIQLLNKINFNIIRKNPKVFCGMSDIGTLFNPIFSKTGLITFHGPIVMHMKKFVKINAHFLKAISPESIGSITPFNKNKWKTIKSGKANGRLVGGTFRIVEQLLGTKFEPSFKNNILLLESLGTNAKEIERTLACYKLHDVFEKISGLVVGNLDGYKGVNYKRVIQRVTKNYEFPILKIEEFGHNCNNITIPIGVKATIDASNKIFSIDESAVI